MKQLPKKQSLNTVVMFADISDFSKIAADLNK